MQFNQAQGSYPQLAGSFQNIGGMSPHDNGRVAMQVPTFGQGIQGLIGAQYAMEGFAGLTAGQSPMLTRAGQIDKNLASASSIYGGIGMASSIMGSLAMFNNPLTATAMILGGGILSARKSHIEESIGLRKALANSSLTNGLTDPYTGMLSLSAAGDLSTRFGMASKQMGMPRSDFMQLATQAGEAGMLSNAGSVKEITKRVMDLAKVTKDIMALGEGITAADAFELQKLLSDMGVSGTKIKSHSIGKNLVQAARAAGVSLDVATQVAGQGAVTFQQLGLGAIGGMNAGSFSLLAANALSRSTNTNQDMVRKLGGAEGLQQSLLAGAGSTMARMSEAVILGSVKMDQTGALSLDTEMVNRYVRGDITHKELLERGRDITKGLSKTQKNKLLENIQFNMPDLREQLGERINTEQIMMMQGREINRISEETGISVRQAAHSFFQDPQQAEAFLAYAKDFKSVSSARHQQTLISRGDAIALSAGKALRGDIISSAGRGVRTVLSGIGTAFEKNIYDPLITQVGKDLAEADVIQSQRDSRALRLLGSNYLTGGIDPDTYREDRDLGFTARDLARAKADKKVGTSAAEELGYIQSLQKETEGSGYRFDLNKKQQVKDMLKKYGMDTGNLRTLFGEDTISIYEKYMEGDSTLNDVGNFFGKLAPGETDATRMDYLTKLLSVKADADRIRNAEQIGTSEPADRMRVDLFKQALRKRYRAIGAGRLSSSAVSYSQLSDIGVTITDPGLRAAYIRKAQEELQNDGDLTEEERAGRDRATLDLSRLLAALPARPGEEEFKKDTLKLSGNTGEVLSVTGLDAAIVKANKEFGANQVNSIISNALKKANSGLSPSQLLRSLGLNPNSSVGAALIKLLRSKDATVTDKEGKVTQASESGGTASEAETAGRVQALQGEALKNYTLSLKSAFAEGTDMQNIFGEVNRMGQGGGSEDFLDDAKQLLNKATNLTSYEKGRIENLADDLQTKISTNRISPDEARTRVLNAIKQAVDASDKLPDNKQGSITSEEVMGKISAGLDAFTLAMNSIVTQASQNGNEVVLKLSTGAK